MTNRTQFREMKLQPLGAGHQELRKVYSAAWRGLPDSAAWRREEDAMNEDLISSSAGDTDERRGMMAQRSAAVDAAFCLPLLRPGLRLLDCGCGPGSISLDLADVVSPGEVIGIDVDLNQIFRARTLAEERKVANVRFEQGDAYELAFPEASFDFVFANQLLLWLSDPMRALKEFRRVLRPGGIVALRTIPKRFRHASNASGAR